MFLPRPPALIHNSLRIASVHAHNSIAYSNTPTHAHAHATILKPSLQLPQHVRPFSQASTTTTTTSLKLVALALLSALAFTLMRQSLRLPLLNTLRASKKPATAAAPVADARTTIIPAPNPAIQTTRRSLSTTPTAMSLFRPSSLFGFPDLDTFPFGSLGGRGGGGSPFTGALLAPTSDYFRNDNMWSGPKIDIHEEPQAYCISAELPGVKKEDVSVRCDADRRRITIEGQIKSEYTSPRTADEGGEEQQQQQQQQQQQVTDGGDKAKSKEVAIKGEGRVGHPLISERMYGSFSRSFTLPSNANLADDKALKARFQDGLLKLEVPKKSEEITKARQITIE